MTAGCAEKSQQSHKYFLHYSTFASERPRVQTWGRQTCFLSRAPSDLVTSLVVRPVFEYHTYETPLRDYDVLWFRRPAEC